AGRSAEAGGPLRAAGLGTGGARAPEARTRPENRPRRPVASFRSGGPGYGVRRADPCRRLLDGVRLLELHVQSLLLFERRDGFILAVADFGGRGRGGSDSMGVRRRG